MTTSFLRTKVVLFQMTRKKKEPPQFVSSGDTETLNKMKTN